MGPRKSRLPVADGDVFVDVDGFAVECHVRSLGTKSLIRSRPARTIPSVAREPYGVLAAGTFRSLASGSARLAVRL